MEPNLDDVTSRVADLKLMVQNFSEERDWDQFHNPKDLAIGIVTEASELLEIFRFKNDAEVTALLKDVSSAKKIRDELADVLYFALRLAQKYDIDLSKALEEKIRDNRQRYPVEKAKGSNKKYSEL
jgi:NTP pyrophosphatase (non-canonical NTP hydrolase)